MTDVASPLSSWISIETLPNYDDFPHLFLSEQLAKSDLGPISIGWLVGFSDPITPGSVDLGSCSIDHIFGISLPAVHR
jgi:hypothetical protein